MGVSDDHSNQSKVFYKKVILNTKMAAKRINLICFLERRQKPIFCDFWYYPQPFQNTFSSGSEDMKIFSFNINYFLFDFLKVMLFNNCIRLILILDWFFFKYEGGFIFKNSPRKNYLQKTILTTIKSIAKFTEKILGCRRQTRIFIKIAATQLLCCEF